MKHLRHTWRTDRVFRNCVYLALIGIALLVAGTLSGFLHWTWGIPNTDPAPPPAPHIQPD